MKRKVGRERCREGEKEDKILVSWLTFFIIDDWEFQQSS